MSIKATKAFKFAHMFWRTSERPVAAISAEIAKIAAFLTVFILVETLFLILASR